MGEGRAQHAPAYPEEAIVLLPPIKVAVGALYNVEVISPSGRREDACHIPAL